MFKIGERYKLRYAFSSSDDWTYLIRVTEVNEEQITVEFCYYDGSPFSSDEYYTETHRISDFESRNSIIERLTPLEELL